MDCRHGGSIVEEHRESGGEVLLITRFAFSAVFKWPHQTALGLSPRLSEVHRLTGDASAWNDAAEMGPCTS